MAYFSEVLSSTVQESQNGVAAAAIKAIAQGEFLLLFAYCQILGTSANQLFITEFVSIVLVLLLYFLHLKTELFAAAYDTV